MFKSIIFSSILFLYKIYSFIFSENSCESDAFCNFNLLYFSLLLTLIFCSSNYLTSIFSHLFIVHNNLLLNSSILILYCFIISAFLFSCSFTKFFKFICVLFISSCTNDNVLDNFMLSLLRSFILSLFFKFNAISFWYLFNKILDSFF